MTGVNLLELWMDKNGALQFIKLILKPGLLVQPLLLA